MKRQELMAERAVKNVERYFDILSKIPGRDPVSGKITSSVIAFGFYSERLAEHAEIYEDIRDSINSEKRVELDERMDLSAEVVYDWVWNYQDDLLMEIYKEAMGGAK